jgi:3-dehydroquinate dehydratase/shikimate dehydrogenase
MEWIVTLTPEAAPDPLIAIANPPRGAAIIELRLDLFPGIDVAAVITTSPLPVLATLRSTAEGGQGALDPATRTKVLRNARDAGAALIDVEWARDRPLIDDLGLAPEQVILSWHDPSGTPDGLEELAESMLNTSARWVKVIPSAKKVADLVTVIHLQRRFNGGARPSRRLLTFAMGTPGLASRYLAPLLGPPIGFAAWAEHAPAAPGQLTIATTESVIAHLDGPPQRIYGVIGEDVSASLSPALHGAAYRELGMPFIMLPISVPHADELSDLFAPRGSTSFDEVALEPWGWAVTTPYKAQAAAAADRHAPRVIRAAAANTLILGPGQVTAENTDADGVVGSLVALDVDPRGLVAVVQGTGGAARGAAVGLHLAGADVVFRSRADRVAQTTAEETGLGWCPHGDRPPVGSILVNATPLGREPGDPSPFSDDEVSSAAAVIDLVYADHPTTLATSATERGVSVADGRAVLLHQGVAQFAAFTQRLPPKEAMRAALGCANSEFLNSECHPP